MYFLYAFCGLDWNRAVGVKCQPAFHLIGATCFIPRFRTLIAIDLNRFLKMFAEVANPAISTRTSS